MSHPRTPTRLAQLDRLTDGELVRLLRSSADLPNWRLAALVEAKLGIDCSPETVRRWRQALGAA